MKLNYAVERLLDTGWTAGNANHMDDQLERLPDGRQYPSVAAVQREFAREGLELSIKQNLMFGCYRAMWAPLGEPLDPASRADDRHGTVVGACASEAAVYALAQLRSTLVEMA